MRLLPAALTALAAVLGSVPAGAQCALAGLAESPRMPGVPFEELTRRADEAWERGRAEEAVRFYRAGVELNPLWHDGWWRLGLALSDAACFEEARQALRQVVRLRPEAGPGWALLGLSEHALGLHEPALASLTRGVSIGLAAAPDVGRRALHALTLELLRAGDFATPARNLEILLRIEPGDPEVVAACGLMALRIPRLPGEVPAAERDVVTAAGRAACAAVAGRTDEAREGFRELASRFPSVRGVHFAWGLVLSREGSPEALEVLRRETALFPDNGEAHVEIAAYLLERGDPAEALAPAGEAARLLPDSPKARLVHGRALLASGRVEPAIAELEDARRLAPDLGDVYLALAQAYARAGRLDDVERARARLLELAAARPAGR